MNIRCVTTITDALLLAPAWQQLAPARPFLTWDWLNCWWSHFLGQGQLLILVGYDDRDRVLGIAPFFVEPTPMRGQGVSLASHPPGNDGDPYPLPSGKIACDARAVAHVALDEERAAARCVRKRGLR